MESEKEWVLIDTETTGFKDPIFVVEMVSSEDLIAGFDRAGGGFFYPIPMISSNEDFLSNDGRNQIGK